MIKIKIIYLIAFCVMSSVMHSTKSNLITVQEEPTDNYHEIINNFVNWRSLDYGSQMVGFRVDSSDYRHPKHFFQIIMWGFGSKFELHLGLNSKMLLPYQFQQEIPENATITLTYRSQNLQAIKFVTSLYDEEENKIGSDTLSVPDIDHWNTCSEDISLKGGRYFNLELIAEGIEGADSVYLKNTVTDSAACRIPRIDSAKTQHLWIDGIRIEIDGTDVSRYTASEILEPCHINPKHIIALENENSFAQIPELKVKRIVAMGESLHGSEAFGELFFQTVKHQVLHNQCKLILLELDMSLALPLNSFIQGNENFDVDSVLYDIRYTSFSFLQLKNMLLFLKDYNRSAEKRVHLAGIDIRINDVISFPGHVISEYLYMLNKNHNYRKIDTVCYELMNKNNYWTKGKDIDIYTNKGAEIKMIEKQFLSKKMLGDTELAIFSYYCHNHIKIFSDMAYIDLTSEPKLRNQLYISRERWMFDNAKHLIDLLCGNDNDSKVLIYAHAGHTSLKEEGAIPRTFGQYMKDYYRDQYFNICLITNGGRFLTVHRGILEIMPLHQDKRSMEWALSGFAGNCMYVPVRSVVSPHTSIRNIGNQYLENQFKIITPSIHFDAFIYQKETEAATCLPGVIGTCNDIVILSERWSRQHQRILEKIDRYDIYY